jgi:hypothetical protein
MDAQVGNGVDLCVNNQETLDETTAPEPGPGPGGS